MLKKESLIKCSSLRIHYAAKNHFPYQRYGLVCVFTSLVYIQTAFFTQILIFF